MLPYPVSGPLVRQWTVRARSFEAFERLILEPARRRATGPLRVLDLGAGNGWLSWRVAVSGGEAVAVDLRDDTVDGLGAAPRDRSTCDGVGGLQSVAASFDALPLKRDDFDIVVFNAALHYAEDLRATLCEARRVVREGGRVVVLDTPFYHREADGLAMVEEKRGEAVRVFGERADALTSFRMIEFLTRDRLEQASAPLALHWRRHRVRYPLWYELRPLLARLRGTRRPSRFDLWEGTAG